MPNGQTCGLGFAQGAGCGVLPSHVGVASEAAALGTYAGRLLQAQPTPAILDEFSSLYPAFGEAFGTVTAALGIASAGRTFEMPTFDQVNDDYINLFVGLGHVKAAPWGSVYSSQERLVFQPETLEVRAWYRRFGCEPAKLGSEPDDHIGTELEFLGGLISTDRENARLFARRQPARWVGAWASLVYEHARCSFYPLLAQAAETVVEWAAR